MIRICCLLALCIFVEIYNLQAQIEEKHYDAMEWRSIGPYRGGRSAAVVGVADNVNLFYFGATGGGVWKTTDGGGSWSNISDGYFGGSIGAIDVSQSDNNVIYVGGGEVTVRGNVSSGSGMWKSEDAGKTWKSIGLKNSRHIPRIRIHPTNPDIVYAAVLGDLYKSSIERGVYKSIDGGHSWKKVLYANADAGAVDLCMDPSNHRILYASTWNVRRTPYSLSSGGEGSGLWKSTDSGETWTLISANKGLPKGIWGISGVTVSPVDSDRIWAIIENEEGGVYRSDDGGETWSKTNDERALRQRAWYYTRIYADTENKDRVYVVNVAYHVSDDGGKTFESAYAPHGDHHDLWIDPNDNSRMIMGDDGGAQVSFDTGKSWSTYHNQPTAQFYRVTTDNHFPYRIYVAQQDNSTIRIPHRTRRNSINESHWEPTAGGESAHIAVDPLDNDIVYGGSYGGYLTRLDHKTGNNQVINVWPDNPMGYGAEGMRYRFQWNFPIFFSKHKPKKLYTASNHLHLSENEGKSWSVISPDLTRNDTTKLGSSGGPITKDNTSVEYYCTIFAAAESPVTEGVIWTGSDDGLIHLTQDGGGKWTNVTPQNMPEWTMVNSVEPDPFNEGGCYIACTSYKLGDYTPYLYKTDNYGATWQKITSGIPDEDFTRVLRADPIKEGVLYAGTESCVYISYSDGQQWSPLQLNLPTVPITDLIIKDNNLIAATQGRSIWMLDDLTVFHQEISKSEFTLFKPKESYQMKGGQNKNIKNQGINHPAGVMVYTYLQNYEEGDTVSLHFKTMDGDTIRTFSTVDKENKLELETGSNVFTWDMRYEDAKKFDGMIMWAGSLKGAKVTPGEYIVDMNVNGKSKFQTFTIKDDPTTNLSAEDHVAKFAFINEINNKVSESHQAIIDMREIREKMKSYQKILKDNQEINDKIENIDSTLFSIENELYQTKNRSRQDPLNYPIKLTNKLAHLNSLMQRSDGPPTQQSREVKEELEGKIDVQLQKYDTVLEEELPYLNQLIRDNVSDPISTPRRNKKTGS